MMFSVPALSQRIIYSGSDVRYFFSGRSAGFCRFQTDLLPEVRIQAEPDPSGMRCSVSGSLVRGSRAFIEFFPETGLPQSQNSDIVARPLRIVSPLPGATVPPRPEIIIESTGLSIPDVRVVHSGRVIPVRVVQEPPFTRISLLSDLPADQEAELSVFLSGQPALPLRVRVSSATQVYSAGIAMRSQFPPGPGEYSGEATLKVTQGESESEAGPLVYQDGTDPVRNFRFRYRDPSSEIQWGNFQTSLSPLSGGVLLNGLQWKTSGTTGRKSSLSLLSGQSGPDFQGRFHAVAYSMPIAATDWNFVAHQFRENGSIGNLGSVTRKSGEAEDEVAVAGTDGNSGAAFRIVRGFAIKPAQIRISGSAVSEHFLSSVSGQVPGNRELSTSVTRESASYSSTLNHRLMRNRYSGVSEDSVSGWIAEKSGWKRRIESGYSERFSQTLLYLALRLQPGHWQADQRTDISQTGSGPEQVSLQQTLSYSLTPWTATIAHTHRQGNPPDRFVARASRLWQWEPVTGQLQVESGLTGSGCPCSYSLVHILRVAPFQNSTFECQIKISAPESGPLVWSLTLSAQAVL